MPAHRPGPLLLVFLLVLTAAAHAAAPQLVFLDTDIGDDIDDAFAVTLLLQSPELHLLGISTTFGDTTLRARLLTRLLADTGHTDIPVAAGPPTPAPSPFTQRAFAERVPATGIRTDGVGLLLDTIRAHPHQVTLIALGPLTTVDAAITRDPATFRLLKQVFLMGGSVRRGYGSAFPDPSAPIPGPDSEWNIRNGVAGARALLASGVPLTIFPLDSTRLPLDEPRRATLFSHGSPLTDDLTLLYTEWAQPTPVLYDPLVVATLLDPALCTTLTPMRLRVDDGGYTREEPGPPNAQVCLASNREAFLNLLLTRLLTTPAKP